MAYWRVNLLDEPIFKDGKWTYAGVPSCGVSVEYGDSPVRDKASRLEFIRTLAEAGANFTVERIERD